MGRLSRFVNGVDDQPATRGKQSASDDGRVPPQRRTTSSNARRVPSNCADPSRSFDVESSISSCTRKFTAKELVDPSCWKKRRDERSSSLSLHATLPSSILDLSSGQGLCPVACVETRAAKYPAKSNVSEEPAKMHVGSINKRKHRRHQHCTRNEQQKGAKSVY